MYTGTISRIDPTRAERELREEIERVCDDSRVGLGGIPGILHDMACRYEAEFLALAAAASGGDVKQAPGEAPQSGPNEDSGNAQRRS